MADSFKLISLNVRGLKNKRKMENIFYWLRKQNCDIAFLQETHCHNRQDEYCWGKEWDGQSVWGWGTNNSKGVAILFNRKNKHDFDIIERDMNGWIIVIDVKFHNNMYRLINIYAPNHPLGRETFFQNTVNNLADCNHDRGECDHVKEVATSGPFY